MTLPGTHDFPGTTLAARRETLSCCPVAGCLERFGHADATCDNVWWTGKRTGHLLDLRLFTRVGMPQQLRRADHLRTLLCGLAAILPAKELSGMVRRALAVYSDRNVLAPLKETFCYWNRRPRVRGLVMPATLDPQWRCLLETVSSSTGFM